MRSAGGYYATPRRLDIGLIVILLAAVMVGSLAARGADNGNAELALELNTLEPVEDGCRTTFVVANRLGARIDALVFELALFRADGAVSGLISADAGSLPKNKTRVKRFALPGVACEQVDRLLLNDITQCDGEALNPAVCLERLTISSRARPDFGL